MKKLSWSTHCKLDQFVTYLILPKYLSLSLSTYQWKGEMWFITLILNIILYPAVALKKFEDFSCEKEEGWRGRCVDAITKQPDVYSGTLHES